MQVEATPNGDVMLSEESHLSDQELLQAVDGELAARYAARVQSHLAACWACRARKQEIESAIGEFIRLHRRNFDVRIPPPDGPRALLHAQLAQLNETGRTSAQPTSWLPWFRAAAAACVLVSIAYVVSHAWSGPPATHLVAVTVPNPRLTPGATVLVSQGEVCRESNTKNKAVPLRSNEGYLTNTESRLPSRALTKSTI